MIVGFAIIRERMPTADRVDRKGLRLLPIGPHGADEDTGSVELMAAEFSH